MSSRPNPGAVDAAALHVLRDDTPLAAVAKSAGFAGAGAMADAFGDGLNVQPRALRA